MAFSKEKTNQIKENLTATLQAILADESVRVEFESEVENNFFTWNQNLIASKKNVILPKIEDEAPRAAIDLAACYLLFHDSKIHLQTQTDQEDGKFFDEFEKIRVIGEVKNHYFGVVQNILSKIEKDIFSSSSSLSLILLKEIFSKQILPKTQDAANDLEVILNKNIVQKIKNLSKKTSDQESFLKGVEEILEMLKSEQKDDQKEQDENNNTDNNDESEGDLNNLGPETVERKQEEEPSDNQPEESEENIKSEQESSKISDGEQKGEMMMKLDKSASNDNKIEFRNAYKIFTSKFDEVVFPQKLVNKNDLELLRDQLDLRIGKLSSISKKMSLKLKRKLLSKRNSFLERDASRGMIDRKKLTRLVIDSTIEDIWINNKSHEYQDTALTILLDNSGSMRGNPIVMSALACEIITEILEKFSVKTEIIGFTTADWKGGRARKMWESSGSGKNPGRLNELRHIIYKHFDQKFKKAKINLGLMLKEGILKENIDGEALLFARSRLMQRSEKRKILLVISDGTPIDDSTSSANDSDILSDHLTHVVNKIEKAGKIEIVGIGIGHMIDDFYRNSISIKGLEELGDVMIEKIAELL